MSARVRVAQVVTKFVAGAGGITLRGALALDPDRYAVTIFAADGGPLFAQAELAGIDIIRLRHMSPTINPGEDVRGVRELVGHLGADRFDLVHSHSAKAGAIGRIAARRVGTPAIVHSFHGFPFHDFQSPARRAAYIAIERWLGRFTDQFLTDGGAVAAEAVRLHIAPSERIRAIDSPVETNVPTVSPATREHARRLLGIAPHVPVIGSVGRLDHQKAPEDMVMAIAALGRPDVTVVWVGDGHLRTRVERRIAREGLAGRFVLLGERQDVPALLPGFDVFAMSSLYEGLPCAVVEAMTCGVPVVATAVNSVPEVVVAGKTGLLVPTRDPASLARALAYLLDHTEEAAQMAAEARLRLGGRFRAETLGRDLTAVYELALRRPAAMSPASLASATPASDPQARGSTPPFTGRDNPRASWRP
jgi:glycosyltransferase involved in cell wall biosynthesis